MDYSCSNMKGQLLYQKFGVYVVDKLITTVTAAVHQDKDGKPDIGEGYRKVMEWVTWGTPTSHHAGIRVRPLAS